MDKQRILKEAQRIAKDFSFWMVSGNITHLYGYVYESGDKKYELEIKFDENFPNTPPQMNYHNEIEELLGPFQLNNLVNWTPESAVANIIHELKTKIEDTLKSQKEIIEKQTIPIEEETKPRGSLGKEEYIIPDLNAYPPDFQYDDSLTSSESPDDLFYTEKPYSDKSEDLTYSMTIIPIKNL